MSIEANKTVIRQFYTEVVGAGDFSSLDDLVASGYVDHNAEKAGRGPMALRAHVTAMRTTFPDFTIRIEDMVAEGEKVVTRVTGQGTHSGGWMDIPPTGKLVSVRGINIDRLEDGRIAEHWGEADTVGMLRQMGVDVFAIPGGTSTT